ADGSVLRTLHGDQVGAQLGNFGGAIGDVNGDGFDDVLASEPQVNAGYPPIGRVFLFSGQDGSILLQLDGTSTARRGGALRAMGDLDGDHVPDFAVAAGVGDSVELISGATGATIRTLRANDPKSEAFGNGLLNPGDLDGDGVNDLIVIENSCYYT